MLHMYFSPDKAYKFIKGIGCFPSHNNKNLFLQSHPIKNMKTTLKITLEALIAVCVCFFSFLNAHSTHIRAGEIIVRRLSASDYKYEIKVIGYTNTSSTADFGMGQLTLGDGTILTIDDVVTLPIINQPVPGADNVGYNTLVFEHTYSNRGTFIIGYTEPNRDEGVLNIPNSVNTPFYVETKIVINSQSTSSVGLNRSPVFTSKPIDKANVGSIFFHNPGAYDPDGDSLSFSLITPQSNAKKDINGYRPPNFNSFYTNINYAQGNEAKNGEPLFYINDTTGTLTWDAPGDAKTTTRDGTKREYNIAFKVTEWRKNYGTWNEIGYVVRDMQIIVEETDNKRPELITPPDTCLIAGNTIEKIIRTQDPENLPMKIELFGAMSQDDFINPPTIFPKFIVPEYIANAKMNFLWKTSCENIRDVPYQAIFKVTDTHPAPFSSPRLVNFKTWEIQVVPPPPQNLIATPQPKRTIKLTWDKYVCPKADSIQIWRKVDSFAYSPKPCELGIPKNGGYELITKTHTAHTEYTDDNNKKGLAPAATYCYRIVANVPYPYSLESIASDEACTTILGSAPIITNVDINKTDTETGELSIKWKPPFQIDSLDIVPPYTYKILKKEKTEPHFSTLIESTPDTFFIEKKLNTADKTHFYKIMLLDKYKNIRDSSAIASSVRAEIKPSAGSLELTWSAETPWTIKSQKYPTHNIFRNNAIPQYPDSMVKISEVNIFTNELYYADNGTYNSTRLSENTEYCYYIQTLGTYQNPRVQDPLLNSSQIICSKPKDTIPPCLPTQFTLNAALNNDHCESKLNDQCQFENISNTITWQNQISDTCQNDLAYYKIYFTDDINIALKPIATVTINQKIKEQQFIHTNIPSFKGCYYITSVDKSNNESKPTEKTCVDNCPFIYFPNVFTPNNDKKNDVFTPYYYIDQTNSAEFNKMLCIRFVKNLTFFVFNKDGVTVYNYDSRTNENSIFIQWNGKGNNGKELESGVYFFEASVELDVLDTKNTQKKYKGWIQIMR